MKRCPSAESPPPVTIQCTRMKGEILSPGVQDRRRAEHTPCLAREEARIASEGGQRFVGGTEEKIVEDPRSMQSQRAQLVRQGEDHVEVVDGEQVGTSCFEPVGLRKRLALRAVPVATGVIDGARVPTAVTGFQVTAEGRSAALPEGAEHVLLLDGHGGGRGDVTLAMLPHDLTQLQCAPRRGRLGRQGGRTHDGLLGGEVEQVRADASRVVGRLHQMDVARGGAHRAMAEQTLKGMEIHPGFEHVGCKGVTQ